ncbi:MAG: SUMF1/EgtB/PvdO family nonheme iron enzyme [Phycisphaerae bacterium]|nr:SUMF1/EgtB/PvdO family nonheme iron enzyme [Phycisphaerae bacterium]
MVSKLTGILVVVVCLCAGAQAKVVIPTVTVGNPGNAGEWSGESYGGHGPNRICGAVDDVYDIGKYEVTVGQYTEFLNAVAGTDSYDLYHSSMSIQRGGTSGSYTYSPTPGRTNWPVAWVSWGDAARFANWLYNDQPTGSQNPGTTEDGSYYLNGAMTATELMAITRKSDATWVIPNEDEWYKAAYHKNDGVTSNYWDYPTQSNNAPTAENPPGTDMVNGSANYDDVINHPIDVGSYTSKPSDSPYGTFDQGGNLNEWTEEPWETLLYRTTRGGTYDDDPDVLHAAHRWGDGPAGANQFIGFRVAIPEPATLSLLTLSGLLAIRRRR